MNVDLIIAQLQAYDDLIIEIKHKLGRKGFVAERWIANYQQMTGSSQVPLEVLKAIVDHVKNMEC